MKHWFCVSFRFTESFELDIIYGKGNLLSGKNKKATRLGG